MFLGDTELYLLHAGGWTPDGGFMFGVVPKVLWERYQPADEKNRIRASASSLVVRKDGRTIVIETGMGTKLDQKRAAREGLWAPEALMASLGRIGIRPDEVDVVIATHLHWDHAGGFTARDADGAVTPAFPKAKFFVQRSEWDFALAPDPRSAAGYLADDFLPAEEAGLVEFVEGDAEVLPGIWLRHTGGHTPGHQFCVVRARDEMSVVVTGDVIPTVPHLRVPWTLSPDLFPLEVMKQKERLLAEAAAHRWLLVLGHDPDEPAGYVDAEGNWTPEPELQREGL